MNTWTPAAEQQHRGNTHFLSATQFCIQPEAAVLLFILGLNFHTFGPGSGAAAAASGDTVPEPSVLMSAVQQTCPRSGDPSIYCSTSLTRGRGVTVLCY
ncbi:unnamed protein product [Merluccius merluccius]